MTQDSDSDYKLYELRQHAEAALAEKAGSTSDISTLSSEDVESLIHDLHVHQIELEMQNKELRQAQLALEESRDRYLDLYDYAPVGYFTLDKNALVLGANLSGAGLLGMERDRLMNKPFSRFVHKESQDTFYFHRNQVLQAGTPNMCEIKLVKPDGSWFHARLESTGTADSDGELSRLRTAISDITDRKLAEEALRRAHDEFEHRVDKRTAELRKTNEQLKQEIAERKKGEEALRSSEERFQGLVESARDLIFMKDRHLTYTHANPAMARMFGVDVSEIIGRKDEDLYGEAIGKHIKQVDLRVLQGESIEEESIASIKGVAFTLNTVLAPLRDKEGAIIGIYGISRDVTDRKRTLPSHRPIAEAYPSHAMRAALHEARLAAATDSIVLLQGASGSGKDYLARWIHDHSRRAPGPYFAVNCAAISANLAESELFGHERGSFTGAHVRKRGLLELAEGGTLLLNEIGELTLSLQSKLLTFLDTRSFLRVGGEKSITVNARIIAATNKTLETEVVEGRFLSPLLYRLNVFAIHVPPLRDRIEDIPVLMEEIMSRLAVELQLTALPATDPAVVIALSRYHWPGNVRELRNVLERSLMLSDGQNLNVALPLIDASRQNCSHVSSFPVDERTLRDVTDEVIKSLCLEALRRCEGNKRCAARALGIARESLYRHMKRFGIDGTIRPRTNSMDPL